MTTASFAIPERSAAAPEGLSLSAHVQACAAARGRTFAMRCLGERLYATLSPRFFTTVFATAALIALIAG